MKYLISIGIPSSGRITTLNQNIEYLKNLIIKNNIQNYVEVVISDTAEKLNCNLKSKYNLPFINYYHFDNEGLDKNIYNIISKSLGRYIWFCQDHTKINEASLLKVIDILIKNRKLKYIFVSTKNNYKLDSITNYDNRLIGFKCIYLNTNIVEKNAIQDVYSKILTNFNGSHVVFLHSIIYILLKLKNNFLLKKQILILKNKNSEYKYFDKNNEHTKFTWSNDLSYYLKILSFSKLMIADIKNSFSIEEKLINKIYKKKDYSVPTIYKIGKLIVKLESNKRFYDKKILHNVFNHPTFDKIDVLFLKFILKDKPYILFCLKYCLLLEFYFLFSLPKVFFYKLFIKLKNFFWS